MTGAAGQERQAASPAPDTRPGGGHSQFVVFPLDDKMLAVDIHSVHEIIRMVEITPFPRMPAFALGVINLRGRIVPVINLRSRLRFPDRQPTARTCIILVQGSEQVIGFLIDDVAEVVSLAPDQIELSGDGPEWMHSDLFSGVGKLPGRLLVIINPARLLSPEEEEELHRAGPSPGATTPGSAALPGGD